MEEPEANIFPSFLELLALRRQTVSSNEHNSASTFLEKKEKNCPLPRGKIFKLTFFHFPKLSMKQLMNINGRC